MYTIECIFCDEFTNRFHSFTKIDINVVSIDPFGVFMDTVV